MIPLATLKAIPYLLAPLAVVVFQRFAEGNFLQALFIFAAGIGVLLVGILPFQVLSWAYYTYRFEAGYLHIKQGVIFKKERSIKRERVQTVNITRGIIQRLFGLAGLQVETAGGGAESELSLDAVTLEEAYRIKRNLEGSAERGGDAAGEETSGEKATWGIDAVIETALPVRQKAGAVEEESPSEAETVYQASYPELFLAGATSGGFLVLFSILGVIFSQVAPYIPETFWEFLLEQVTSIAAVTIALVVFVLLLLSWIISTVTFVVQHANFTLRRSQDRLQISWGIIEQKQLALNLNRLQALAIHEGIIRQPFGRCALIAEVAGGGSKEQNYVTLLFPLLRNSELPGFLEKILPEYRLPSEMVPLPRRALRRYIFRAVALSLLVIIPLQWAPYGWLAFLLLIPAFFWGRSRYYAGGTAVDEQQLSFRFRFINRFRVLMRRNCIQSFQVSVNPFQRGWNLRTVRAWVLSSPEGKSFQVTDTEQEEASRLWEWYSRTK